MKYKVSDKVKLIRGCSWNLTAYQEYDKLLNHVATIKRISLDETCYFMKEIGWGWQDYEIEKLVLELIIEPELMTITRFELMDFE